MPHHFVALLLTETFLASPVCVFLQDLAQSVNEVKRDNEIIRQITTFQLSIENMVRSRLERLSRGFPLVFALRAPHHLRPPSVHADSVSGTLRPAQDRRRAEDLQPGEEVQTGQVSERPDSAPLQAICTKKAGLRVQSFRFRCSARFLNKIFWLLSCSSSGTPSSSTRPCLSARKRVARPSS